MTGYSLVSSLFVAGTLIGGAPIGTQLRLVAVAWGRDKNRDGEVCCDSQYDLTTWIINRNPTGQTHGIGIGARVTWASKGAGESVVGIGARVTWVSVRDMPVVGIRVRIRFY